MVFRLEHFRQFCYGHPVTIKSNHKPLENIFIKPISMAPMHLQRMLLRISIFEINLMYIKGKKIKTADCLWRLIKANRNNQISGLDIVVHNMEYTVSREMFS